MEFYSNLTIFCQISPHFWGKLTRFVAVLGQNTCVCDCKPVLCTSKVNNNLWRRFMKAGMEIMDILLLQSCHFPPANPHFRAKVSCGGIILKCQCGGHTELFTGPPRTHVPLLWTNIDIYWYSCDEQPYMVAFLHNHPEPPHDWGLDE